MILNQITTSGFIVLCSGSQTVKPNNQQLQFQSISIWDPSRRHHHRSGHRGRFSAFTAGKYKPTPSVVRHVGCFWNIPDHPTLGSASCD